MSSGGQDEDYDMPLLVRTSSLSPRSNYSPVGLGFAQFSKSPKTPGSNDRNTNIAAVSDDMEALAFPEPKKAGSDRTSNSSSPVSIVEENEFETQFDSDVIGIIASEDKDDSAVATVFDDNTSNDESLFTNEDDKEDVKSLKPPSIVLEEKEDEKEGNDAAKNSATDSVGKKSKASRKSSKGGSDSRLSSSSRKHSVYLDDDEDADAATWKADEIDAIVDADGFGSGSDHAPMEITGVDLLTERDSSVNELQEVNHLMTFNALVLIQKQKDWIEGSIDATNGANKGTSAMITMELENLERKIKLLMDNKAWPNALERRKQKKNPFTPSKAFFKSMSLIDKSIEQFHKGYLKQMSTTSQENHDLKTSVEKLIEVNASLQEAAERSSQKTETIRRLQKHRENLMKTVDSTEQMLASFLVNAGPNMKKESSNIQTVKSYIQRLEDERKAHLAEIETLKRSAAKATADDSSTCSNDEYADSEINPNFSYAETEVMNNCTSVTTEVSDDGKKMNDDAGILDEDLGSKWNTLEKNELEIASKDDQIKSLKATVAGQESALESVRAECKLMRMQLVQLETTRNEFKNQCDLKDSALEISQSRISSLEEEVLRTHAQCATYEEDYEAMRESFATQKVATKQEIDHTQDGVKAKVEQVRDEFKEKLKREEEKLKEVEDDRDRVVRDLKTSLQEIEAERDSLQAKLAGSTMRPISPAPINSSYIEEKKEDEDVRSSPVLVSPQSSSEAELIQMRSRFAEKASKQAFTIAQLTEENEMKDEQLKSLQEMVEMLLGKRNGDGELIDDDNNSKRGWGKRISNLRARTQQRASDLRNRSRHGGSMHGSQHGTWHGSMHGECLN